ncbi:hypothetical protein ABW19_dt0207166 [Dactylella cylindrospora]|nr:hypothetical protein ABW19_dt0207166 [Dactylella cylindrospora]
MIPNLPHELQTHILSFLPISDQIIARGVCSTWDRIIKSKTLLRTRYAPNVVPPPDPDYGHEIPSLHLLLIDRRENSHTTRLQCRVEKGELKSVYLHRWMLQGYIPTWMTADKPKHESFNIINNPVLDEPLFSPFLNLKEALESIDPNGIKIDPISEYPINRHESAEEILSKLQFEFEGSQPDDEDRWCWSVGTMASWIEGKGTRMDALTVRQFLLLVVQESKRSYEPDPDYQAEGTDVEYCLSLFFKKSCFAGVRSDGKCELVVDIDLREVGREYETPTYWAV